MEFLVLLVESARSEGADDGSNVITQKKLVTCPLRYLQLPADWQKQPNTRRWLGDLESFEFFAAESHPSHVWRD